MKYSVIVPVYGVERYLNQCVKSVLAQSFRDFELILVDDRSPDRCPQMCDAWAEKDERIRVIHKPENEGLGFARNSGIAAARGEYITFLDSDDYVTADHLHTCDDALEPDTDILVFGIESVFEDNNGNTVHREIAAPAFFCARSGEEKGMLFAQLSRAKAFPFACNKMYRRQFLLDQQARFEKTRLIEDFLFNVMLFEKAEKITAIANVLYNYRKPAHETLASAYAPEFFELSKRKYILEDAFLKKCGAHSEDYTLLICQNYLKHVVSAVIRNHSVASGLSWKQQLEKTDVMLRDQLTLSVMERYTPRKLKYRLMRKVLDSQNSRLVMLLCLGVAFMQKRMLLIYRKLLNR